MDAGVTPVATPMTPDVPSQSHHHQPAPEATANPMGEMTGEVAPAPIVTPEPKYEEPLYTEINIPLPPIPKPKPSSPKSRPRAHTLASYSPFHKRSSSNSSNGKEEEEWPRVKKEVKNKDIASVMNLSHRHKRSGTVDALAVVPTVLVLSAELFTPGEGDRKDGERGKWEDSIR